MADVRALLKAKRQEVRITHPYAAYGANGALRCSACGAGIKFASAWEGHLGSKAHRVAVANLRAKEEGAKRITGAVSKRKAGEEGEEGGDGEVDVAMEMAMGKAMGKKRQRTEEREIALAPAPAPAADVDGSLDARMGTDASHAAFPADFFSDPARAPLRTSAGGQDGDDEGDEMDQDAKPAPKSQFEMEWDAFEHDMQKQQQQRRPLADGADSEVADPQEMYARATIAAEAELVPRFEGLPVDGDGTAAQEGTGMGGGGIEEGGRKVSEEEKERRRKERDERELIMDRLMEEERAQEDAYGRVALLKNRVQMLKQKRELAKAKGKKAADMET